VLFGKFDFASSQQLFVAVKMCLDASELFKQLVVLQNFEIFDVEVGFVVALELFAGLSRIDTL
jgi:hypothetical protein